MSESGRTSRPARRALIVTIALLLVALPLAWYLGRTSGERAAEPIATATPVVVVPVEQGLLETTLTLRGSVAAEPTRVVVATRGGRVTSVPKSVTDERGARVVSIDGRGVYLMPGSTPEWRDMTLNTAGADVRQLNKALRAMGYSEASKGNVLSRGSLTAWNKFRTAHGASGSDTYVPLGDVVFISMPKGCNSGSVTVSKGDFVTVGDTIAAFPCGAPQLEVPLADDSASVVAVGDTVRVRIQGATESVDGEVVAVTQNEDGTSRAIIAAPGLVPGTQAVVDVVLASSSPDAWIVPTGAIRVDTSGETSLEVVRGGTTLNVDVTVGVESHGAVSVEGALQEGDLVNVPVVSATS